ncbi:cytochrome c oxidase assembly protein [Janibacter limosus]|uniref:cytochrome c oxidase assembly protein n=1 Tax=Janibacter limosus TaxID=53458 RepID=UPI0035D8CDB3
MGMLYVAGAVRLWTSGRRWPVWRCLSFLLGCGAIMVIMGAGIEGYGLRMFSVFMFQQLTLMLGIPAFLALGSPGTLLLRATPHRGPGRPVLRLAFFGLQVSAGTVFDPSCLHGSAVSVQFLRDLLQRHR